MSESRSVSFGRAEPGVHGGYQTATIPQLFPLREPTLDPLRLSGVYTGNCRSPGSWIVRKSRWPSPYRRAGAFVDECPPFRALMLGLVHALFEFAIRDKQVKKDKRVGRIDLFCAMYLPYCDLFITNDDEQRRCLTEIVAAGKLPVEVLSFTDFRNRLTPLAHMSVGAKVAIAGLAIAIGVGSHRDALPVHVELPIPAEPSQLTASVTFTPTANVAAVMSSFSLPSTKK